MMKNKLDLGCGQRYLDGFLRIDFNKKCNPDIVTDFEKLDWYNVLPTNFFIEIECDHVIEHLNEINPLLQGISKICVDKAKFRFSFPDFRISFIEPDHRRGYGLHALIWFPEFVVTKIDMCWSERKNKGLLYRSFNKIISWLANRNPYICERIWSSWVGGFSDIILVGYIDKSKISTEWYNS